MKTRPTRSQPTSGARHFICAHPHCLQPITLEPGVTEWTHVHSGKFICDKPDRGVVTAATPARKVTA